MGKHLHRFHREIYFPDKSEQFLERFIKNIQEKGPLTFSLHAVEKVLQLQAQFGLELCKQFSNTIREGLLDSSRVFEFYWYKEGKITKACFRHSYKEFPVDVIAVVSDSGNIITIYSTNKNDVHTTMDTKLYERRRNAS